MERVKKYQICKYLHEFLYFKDVDNKRRMFQIHNKSELITIIVEDSRSVFLHPLGWHQVIDTHFSKSPLDTLWPIY